jgi:hypothetical protein
MKLNLDTLRKEIVEYLQSRNMIVFHSLPRTGGPGPAAVYWDSTREPDFRRFLAAAEAAGVRLVTLYARELEEDLIDDTLEQLGAAHLDRDEERGIEMRLKEMSAYAGFTCEIELSFDLAARVYIFDLRTEWFDDLNDLVERIDAAYLDDEDEEEGPLGNEYFSRN